MLCLEGGSLASFDDCVSRPNLLSIARCSLVGIEEAIRGWERKMKGKKEHRWKVF